MNNENLSKWADLLLDMGKRNNLVNFRATKMGTAEIVAPDFGTLFKKMSHSSLLEVYDPINDEYEAGLDDLMNTQGGEDDPAEEPRISREEYRRRYEGRLKRGQVLLYTPTLKPISALKNISKKGRTAIEETGVNIVYLALGFINWREHEGAPSMKAPLLLIPASIENESALEPYRIKISDDEIILNPTFAFKMQNEFNITLPEFDSDDDIDAYISYVESTLSRLKWTVSREARLGIFSFLKINMYKDLKDNAEIIAKSKSICKITGNDEEPHCQANECIHSKKGNKLSDLMNVVDADSSQSEAIQLAKDGVSFVLQGPPGTGKSQTITNIIAECLADGKSVLFVSEKLAALNVVYDKLKKAGLDEFCLELHSHKANKKQVIDELCHTLKAQKSALSDRAQRELEIKKKAEELLNSYAEKLHTESPVINKSLYKIFDEISSATDAPELPFIIKEIKDKGEIYFEEAEEVLQRYSGYTETVGRDYRKNPWFGFDTSDYSLEARARLECDIALTAELCSTLKAEAEVVKEKFKVSIDSIESALAYMSFFEILSDSDFISPALLASGRLSSVIKDSESMEPLAKKANSMRKLLDTAYEEDIYKLNGKDIYKRLTLKYSNIFSRIFKSEYRQIVSELRMCRKDARKPKYKEALAESNALFSYQESMASFERIAAKVSPLLGEGYRGVDTDFSRLLKDLTCLKESSERGAAYGGTASLSKDKYSASKTEFKAIFEKIKNAFERGENSEERLAHLFNINEFNLKRFDLTSLYGKLSTCLKSMDGLDEWLEFSKLLKKAETLDIRELINLSIDRKIPPETVPVSFKRLYYTQWADMIIRETPTLVELSRIPHDDVVKRFKEKDELNFEINKAKIRARVSEKRPGLDMIAQGSAVSILLREGEKKRKQKSIRLLLSEISELALSIKPCFLMSPLSVSTFLSSDIQFDTVIFDEASQIFPQDAIGAVYRGKQLIVVGDSKQMPPSNFFNASADAYDEGEEESLTDFESILDLCSISFPQLRLKWHYRSRFEELIAFSNKNFYDNELVTFPSVKKAVNGVGVDYIHVDGAFDRQTKTNRAEAERICELVFEHIETHPERSLGVVAFSVAQQTLIERLIDKRRRFDRTKEEFFKLDKAEPFFVKNLETVQGDERDTVIFSVAYGRDEGGRLLLNFGPINRVGGERRLNVAVTRAKFNIKLVSSMHYSDIDLSRTSSVGARLLREYIDYAENGRIALVRDEVRTGFEKSSSDFEDEVCRFLKENGYEVEARVGCSSFKIDIALKKPHSQDYLLAIECDGSSYHSSKTARDRDRLRQSILENMGWKFYRIWSTDWFRNKKTEKDRLLFAVRSALNSAPQGTNQKTGPISFEEAAPVKHFEFPKYKEADIAEIYIGCGKNILKTVLKVLETEAPVSEEWLLRRISPLYGREKVTSVVTRYYEDGMRNCTSYGIIRKNGFLYLEGKEIPMLRYPSSNFQRDIKYISTEELANGLRALLLQNVSAEKSGLFRLTAQHLGFSRIGDAISARLDEALELIKDELEISQDDIISIKSK